MRIVVLFNPISGAGRAAALSEQVVRTLTAAGHDPHPLASELQPPQQWLEPALADAELMIVVGGDGAVRLAAQAAVDTATPVYHYPAGTENLFAREFGMKRDLRLLIDCLEHHRVEHVDVATVNQRLFLLMTSVGIDAEIVYEVAASRAGAISHLHYLGPLLRQIKRWQPVPLRVTVDGSPIERDGSPACVIIANCRQYGGRIDPGWRASMTDGLLDVVYIPVRSKLMLLKKLAAYRFGRQSRDRSIIYTQCREAVIEVDHPQRYQMDGDPPQSLPGESAITSRASRFVISVHPRRLPVLVPQAWNSSR